MAATIKCYGNAGKHIANGDLNWASDTIKMSLHTNSYTPNQGTDEFQSVLTNEIGSGGGYSTGGFTLTTSARTYDSTTREEQFPASNFSVGALTPAAAFRYAVIYDATPGSAGTNFLLAYINFGADQNPAGLPFAIQWAATGVFYIQAV